MNFLPVPLLAFGLCVLMIPGCSRSTPASAPLELTFTRDIAPIIFEQCATCHRPGGSAPFGLLGYEDVKKHATDIVKATSDHYMPPWLPEPGDVEFADRRHLSAQQIQVLRQWVDQGAVEGDPANLPARPAHPEGWQFGQPDLVIELNRPYVLAAEGADVFRNFVLPVNGVGARYVRAVEIRPGNPRAVHHAWMTVDSTDSCRTLDAADTKPGFAGMETGDSRPPDGHFLAWTPGKMPHPGFADMAWQLTDRMDLVLQLHMLPRGKPETVQPSIGIYFAEKPPTKLLFALLLKVTKIDIAPGERNYQTEQSFTLPVGVQLLSIYPHAHYVCREMEAIATLPDGRELALLEIGDWDFNWQDQYYLKVPLSLPRGTRISMKYVYDNSAQNPRNPWTPPRRIVWGNRSSDEMGTLALQLLPASRSDHALLREGAYKHDVECFGGYRDHYNYAHALQSRGDHANAITHYRRAIALNPNRDVIHHNLAGSLAAVGEIDAAIKSMREAIRLNPEYADAHCHLGNFMVTKKDLDAAINCYRRAIEINPNHAQARQNLDALLKHREKGRATR